MKKQFGLFAVFMLILSSFTGVIAADNSSPVAYEITKVRVDGILADDATNANAINAERGNSMYVEVYFQGNDFNFNEERAVIQDVKVKAWINGYDDDIEASTDKFDIEEDVEYRKALRLDLPEDMDANEDYTLHVQISNKDGYVQSSYPLRIQEQSTRLVIEDVIFNPGLNVDAGETLYTQARIENYGNDVEKNVRVSVRIPALGIQTASYINDLTTQYEDDNNNNNKDDYNAAETTDRMALKIPQYAEAGQYDLFVTVDYNRGRDSVEERYVLTVGGSSGNIMVSAIDSEKTVAPGKGVAYQVSLTNLGSSQSYNFAVEGVSGWGTARVDPSSVTISEDGTADVFVYITANDDAQLSSHQFNLVVKSGSTTVKKVPLVANVQAGLPAFDGFRQGLEIGFAILLVILVILGIVIAARRIGKDSNDEEPLLEEDQTYY